MLSFVVIWSGRFDLHPSTVSKVVIAIVRYINDYIFFQLNSSPTGQNGRHFADDVFKCIFVNKMFCILNRLLLKFVPKGLINNIPALVQIMAWRRPGGKPLSEPKLTQFSDTYITALGGDELKVHCRNHHNSSHNHYFTIKSSPTYFVRSDYHFGTFMWSPNVS